LSARSESLRFLEGYAIVVGVIAYGLMWAGDFDPVNTHNSELANFLVCGGLITAAIVPVAMASMFERFILMVVLGIAAGATVVGGLVLLAIGISNFFKRLDTFVERLPFAVTSAMLYISAWYVPPLLWQQAQQWPIPIWLSAVLVGLMAIVFLLLLAGVCTLLGFSFKMSLCLTLVWGWYLIFVLYLSLSMFGDD